MQNNQLQHNDELSSSNPMKSHYEDPELNKFVDGIVEGVHALELKGTSTIFIRYPRGINKNGLNNLLKGFGDIKRIFVPNSSTNQNYSIAFVDFATFTEAERVVRALNSDVNKGLGIKAEISHGARNKSEMSLKMPENDQEVIPEPPEEISTDDDSIDFKLSYKPNNLREKVSEFEFIPFGSTSISHQHEKLKQMANESNWKFSENYEKAQFNAEVRQNHRFLEFHCNGCHQVASLRDDKTKKYYCSLTCFQNVKEIPEVQSYKLKKSDKVCITSIINEKCIYLRRSSDDLNHLLEQIYRTAKTGMTKLEMIPSIGDEVLVKAFDGIYRGEVMEINDEDELGIKSVVRLVDIGATVEIGIENLFEMTSACNKFISIVHKVMLKDVDVNSINMDVIGYLVNLRNNKKELTIKSIEFDAENINVELKDDEGNFVGATINRLANFDEVNLTPTTIDKIPQLPVSTGLNKKLFVVNKTMLDRNGVLWCLDEKFLKDFYEMQKSLNDYGSKLDAEKYGANTNDLVIVKVKDQWFRACIQEKKGDGKPFCCLIDICETAKIPIENIFLLPTVFTAYPMYSECYEVSGYSKANDKKKKFINNYLHGNDLIIADEVKEGRHGLLIYFSALAE